MAGLFIAMVMFMKEIGLEIKHLVMVYLKTIKDQRTEECGKMINNTEKVV